LLSNWLKRKLLKKPRNSPTKRRDRGKQKNLPHIEN
jgi:hypothetical protein